MTITTIQEHYHFNLIVTAIQIQILPLLPNDPDDNALTEQEHQ
jgi:hypothetical protein